MKVFGLTGGVGMGKSTASQWLRDRGTLLVDTDLLARDLVEPGQPALAEIQRAFGDDIVAPDGQLRRDEMARIAFSDPLARRRLEQILHPRILKVWKQQVSQWRSGGSPLAVVVIPLLFETGAEDELDSTICIACSAATQKQRLRERGWTGDEIERRLAAQWPIEKKMARADFVVWSEGSLEVLAEQLERIIR